MDANFINVILQNVMKKIYLKRKETSSKKKILTRNTSDSGKEAKITNPNIQVYDKPIFYKHRKTNVKKYVKKKTIDLLV